MTTSLTITFPVTLAAQEMLQLDEPSMYYGEYQLEDLHHKSGRMLVRCSLRAAKLMLSDCQDRSSSAGGYDQPVAWYSTARSTAGKIRAALARSI